MRRLVIKTALLLLPFLLMIAVNEISRAINSANTYSIYGVRTINPAGETPEKCTWDCHNSGSYCKKHHLKFLQKYYSYTDMPYNSILRLLRATGNYINANVIYLVFLFPLIIWLMLIKSLDLQVKIKQLRGKK